MGINPLTQAQSQEMAVALNQSMASDLKSLDVDKKLADKVQDKSIIERLISSKEDNNGATRELLSQLASKVAASGIDLNQQILGKVQNKFKDEYDMMFSSKDESFDAVSLSTQQKLAVNRRSGQKQQNGGQSQNNKQQDQSKVVELVREYSVVYSQFLLTGGSELKKKIEMIEQKLSQEGVSAKDLLGIQTSIRKGIRSEITSQIKDLYLNKIMSKENSVEALCANKSFNNLLDSVFLNEKLGGWDFGGHLGNLQKAVDEKVGETHQEIRSFIKEELEHKSTQNILFNNVPEKEFSELLSLGKKVDFDPMTFLNQWGQKVVDLGLIPAPQTNTMACGAQTDLSGRGGNKQSTGYEFTKDDEKDLMINQLRALYMRRAIKGDLKTLIETSFKVRKLKNGLIKMGINFGDFEKIEKEGSAVARMKLIEMLNEAFYERATLYELSGPAFEIIERKIKGVLKNMEKVGGELSNIEFEALRDKANISMFDITRAELEHEEIMFKAYNNPRTAKKINILVKLLKRLQEESKICLEFDPENIAKLRSAA